MDKYQAVQQFWASFGIPAFDENTVPSGDDRPAYPYITYDVSVGSLGDFVAMSGSIWDYGTSWSSITTKLSEIEASIGLGGCLIPVDGGAVWIKRGSPFAQRVSDENDMIRRIFMNIEAEYITA